MRIIAGSAGGRRLRTPDTDTTRPTSERVREAFFSALATWAGTVQEPVTDWLSGIAFLDLFAGSGAVGLEAASRGADRVLLVESHRRALEVLRRNVSESGLAAQVRGERAEHLLAGPPGAGFDVVWLDPPYAMPADDLDALLARVVEGAWVVGDGVVVVERDRRSPDPGWPDGMDRWQRRYGETVLHWARPGAD